MAVKAKAEITLATIRDVQSVTRYYLLQSSTSSMPSKPTANPPGGSWVKTEPSYTSGSTNSLYFTDLTVFTDASFSYSDVSLSSSYEAAKAAYNKAVAAQENIENLTVGGRNYILRSSQILERSGTSSTLTLKSSELIPAGTTLTLSIRIDADDIVWGTHTYHRVGMEISNPKATSGTQYLGCWAYRSGDTGTGAAASITGNSFHDRISFTWTVETDIAAEHNIGIYIQGISSGTVIVSKAKLEIGNKATDWTPAPEDVNASVAAVEAKADIAISRSVEYIVGTQTAATGSWKGVSMDAALYAGKTIAYKLPYAGSGNASLTLTLADGSATAAIPVYLNTTRVTTHFGAGCVISMTYDGTNWRAASIPNSNTYDRVLHNTAIKASATVTKEHLIAGNADGYKNLAASLMFDLAYPILYASAAIAANATAKTTYEAMPDVNFSTTGTIQSGTAAKILWLKGEVEDNHFTIAASNWMTTVVPTEEDGMYYIPLGVMSSATVGYFTSSDRLYAFVDGAFQPLDNASRKLAEKAREEVVDAEERVRTYAESAVSQKADEIEISISTVTGTLAAGIQDCQESIAQTDEALSDSVVELNQRVSDQEDALLDYKHETSTYFRFNENGLNIGKQQDGDESPYSINLDNEKMAFLQNGSEIAYVQYNKMHINAIEAMDRLSVGAAADGGYFDFISTEYGMGVKWRAVQQSNGVTLNSMRAGMKLMARRAAEYIPVEDESGVFKVDFGGEKE